MAQLKQKFNLVIDLTWRSNNKSDCSVCESFEISFYRLCDDIHNIQIKKGVDKLCEFLKSNDIEFEKELFFDEGFWINFELKSDIYLDVLHHIELRAKN